MAEIQRLQTGNRTKTHIRGRVFRYAPQKKAKEKRAKELRIVCILNHHDGRLLEHWSVSQPCHGPKCQHAHMTRDTVTALVKDGVLRLVPGSNGNVAAYSYGRTWKAVPSDNVKVMQLV